MADQLTSTTENPSQSPFEEAQKQQAANTFTDLARSPLPDVVNKATDTRVFGTDLSQTPAYQQEQKTISALLKDPQGLGGIAPEVVKKADNYPDPQAFKDMAVNIRAMSFLTGADIDSVSENYPMVKRSLAANMGWNPDASDSEMRGNIARHFDTQEKRSAAISDLTQRSIGNAFDDAQKGMSTDPLVRFSEWRDAHPEAMKGLSEQQQLAAFNSIYLPIQHSLNTPEGQAAKQFVDALRAQQMARAEADFNQSASSFDGQPASSTPPIDPAQYLKGLSPEDQDKALAVAQQYFQFTNKSSGVPIFDEIQGLGKSFMRGVGAYGSIDHLDALVEAQRNLAASVTPEDRAKYQSQINDINLARKVDQFNQGVVLAPPFHQGGWDGWVSQFSNGLAEMVPQLAPFAVPVLGEYAMYKQAQAENAFKLMDANPGMSADEARNRSTIGSAAYAITIGKGLKLLGAASPGLAGFLGHVAGSTAIMQGAEAEKIAFNQFQHAINPDINTGEDAAKQYWELLKATPMTFAQLFTFGAAVHAMQSGRSMDPAVMEAAAKNASDPMALREIGFSQDVAGKIASMPEEQRLAAIKDNWETRTKDIKAGVQLAKENSERVMASLSDPKAPKLTPLQDGGYAISGKDIEGNSYHHVFQTPEGAQDAFSTAMQAHLAEKSKRGEGNDWTEATADDAAIKPQEPIDTTGAEQAASDHIMAQEEAKEPQAQEERQSSHLIPEDYPITYMDPRDLKLSEDVPNFKENADPSTGVVEGEQLQGKLDLKGMGPLLVWERLNGDKEIISGRHRLDLAKRTEAPLVPVQILKESEGHTKADMMALDAEQNIKDEKGTVKDYANYFRNNGTSREEAEAGGLLSRAKGRSGFAIGKGASDDLYALFSAGKISEAKAAAIAQSAQNDAGLQQAAMRKAADLKAEEIPGYIALIKRETSAGGAEQIGLFGDDESFIKEAERLSKAAASRVRELTEQIAAVQGAAKRPEAAAKLGVDVKDPQGLEKRIAELKDQRARFSQFWLHDDLMQQLGAKPSAPTIDANGEGNLFHEKEMPFNLSGETEPNQEPQQEQRKYKEDDQTGYFVMEGPELQAYLDFAHVPEEKRQQAQDAFKAVSEASTTPYPRSEVSDGRGVDRDELRQVREEQAAAYRGLLKNDAEAVKSAIENGIPLSRILLQYAKDSHTPFSIQGAIINSPADLAAHNLAHRTPFFESLKVAVLDNSNQVVHSEIVSIGSLNESIAHPREIMWAVERGKEAASYLGRKIQGWMLMHNHPSGDPSPSEADRRLTRRLGDVAKMVDSPFIDHVITNGETYFSFQHNGLMGGGVKIDPTLQPKLQVIPKPEGLAQGKMSDFEATPASERGKIDHSAKLDLVRATLQTADPGMIHVLNLDTRCGLISVDRHPLEVTPGEIFKRSTMNGTYAIALSLPDTTPQGTKIAAEGEVAQNPWRKFIREIEAAATLYQVPLFDAAIKGFSWRDAGLLEEPAKYGKSDSLMEDGSRRVEPVKIKIDPESIPKGVSDVRKYVRDYIHSELHDKWFEIDSTGTGVHFTAESRGESVSKARRTEQMTPLLNVEDLLKNAHPVDKTSPDPEKPRAKGSRSFMRFAVPIEIGDSVYASHFTIREPHDYKPNTGVFYEFNLGKKMKLGDMDSGADKSTAASFDPSFTPNIKDVIDSVKSGDSSDHQSRVVPWSEAENYRVKEDAAGYGDDGKPFLPSFKDRAIETAKNVNKWVRDLPKETAFKRELLKWSARSQKSSNEIARIQHEITKTVKDPLKRAAITNWIEAGGNESLLRARMNASEKKGLKDGYKAALELTDKEKAIAQKIQDTFRILERRAAKYGIEMGHIENYVPHAFKTEPQTPMGSSAKRLSEFFKFSQERVFDSYFDAEQHGYTARTKDISGLLALYLNDMNNAINSRRFVESLHGKTASDGRPLLSPRGSGKQVGEELGDKAHLVYPDTAVEGTEDYKKLNQPALHDWSFAGKDPDGNPIMVKGDLAVHPEVAKHLDRALSESAISKWLRVSSDNPFFNASKAAGRAFIKGQSYLKGTMLSFSPFHQVQEGIHALGHRINPISGIKPIDLRNPEQMDAVEHGLMLSHDRISQHQFEEGALTASSNLVTKGLRSIGWGLSREAADKIDGYQHWLFSQYIPSLKFNTYTHILERNKERFAKDLESGKVSEWQVKNLSARQANAAYGHLNYTDMGHSPTVRHALQIAFLAPDFFEARARFVGQSMKALVGAKTGSEQLQALMLLAVTQFVAARIFNKLHHDDYDWSHPFEIRVGNRFYGMRSVPEDIYKLFKDPTAFAGGRISPIFGKLVQEGFFGHNYRGEPTSMGDAIKDILASAVPMPMQPLVRELTNTGKANPISPFEQILSATGVQVHRYSPITEVYPLAKEWVKTNYPEDQQKGSYPVSKYQQLRYALEDNDSEKAAAEIAKLEKAGMSPKDISRGFKTSVEHPFTGNKEHDQEFLKSLDENNQQLFHAAQERRKEILRRFRELKTANSGAE